MIAAEPNFDVFLSYSAKDEAEARAIAHALEQEGLSTFPPARQSNGESVWSDIRTALTNSDVLIILLAGGPSPSPDLAVEVGAALAWLKPIYLVTDDEAQEWIPSYLEGFQRFSIDDVEPLVQAIKKSQSEVTSTEQQWLAQWYGQTKVPLDELIRQQRLLSSLASDFAERFERQIPPDRLVQALLRLRKSGTLPRVRQAG